MTYNQTPSAEMERAVMVCPQCEGEGGYADGLDEAACHIECTRCGSNGWIVDLTALRSTPEQPGWRDIADAPRDGTDFVALIPRQRSRLNRRGSWRVLECYWERGMKVPRFIWQGWSTDDSQPVLWMPLPATPDAEGTKP